MFPPYSYSGDWLTWFIYVVTFSTEARVFEYENCMLTTTNTIQAVRVLTIRRLQSI